jgi:hypothetical protein
MGKQKGVLSILIIGLILVFGFQNCQNASFSNPDIIQDQPISSLQPGDTKFKNGLTFDALSKTVNQTISEFRVFKRGDSEYVALSRGLFITCSLEKPNAMEDLMQITEVARITHPSFISNPSICDPQDGKFIHYKIGKESPIYLIAASEVDDCLMDDPQELLNEDKRVFVIDNVSYEEISSLIEDSLELSGSSSCIAKELGEF